MDGLRLSPKDTERSWKSHWHHREGVQDWSDHIDVTEITNWSPNSNIDTERSMQSWQEWSWPRAVSDTLTCWHRDADSTSPERRYHKSHSVQRDRSRLYRETVWQRAPSCSKLPHRDATWWAPRGPSWPHRDADQHLLEHRVAPVCSTERLLDRRVGTELPTHTVTTEWVTGDRAQRPHSELQRQSSPKMWYRDITKYSSYTNDLIFFNTAPDAKLYPYLCSKTESIL